MLGCLPQLTQHRLAGQRYLVQEFEALFFVFATIPVPNSKQLDIIICFDVVDTTNHLRSTFGDEIKVHFVVTRDSVPCGLFAERN